MSLLIRFLTLCFGRGDSQTSAQHRGVGSVHPERYQQGKGVWYLRYTLSTGVVPLGAQVSTVEAKLVQEARNSERARGEAASLRQELTGMKAALDGTAAELTAERASSDA